jgi:hypothetical protein
MQKQDIDKITHLWLTVSMYAIIVLLFLTFGAGGVIIFQLPVWIVWKLCWAVFFLLFSSGWVLSFIRGEETSQPKTLISLVFSLALSAPLPLAAWLMTDNVWTILLVYGGWSGLLLVETGFLIVRTATCSGNSRNYTLIMDK